MGKAVGGTVTPSFNVIVEIIYAPEGEADGEFDG